jgi:hypothetical protein
VHPRPSTVLEYHNTILTGAAPLEAPHLVSFLGWAVSKSTEVNQISPLDRHHPTEKLEMVRFDVSNVPGGLLGPEISQVEFGHLGLAVCRVKLLKGGRPTTQRAHALAAPDTKSDHDLHGGPAVCVHIWP